MSARRLSTPAPHHSEETCEGRSGDASQGLVLTGGAVRDGTRRMMDEGRSAGDTRCRRCWRTTT